MNTQLIIPSQIRAGRALLGWSQEQLAKSAKIGLSSVRDIENQKRPADSDTTQAVQKTLESQGVVFIFGDGAKGPGVHLKNNRPNLVRRPTVVTKWYGMPFVVEWQGEHLTVSLMDGVIEFLEGENKLPNKQLLYGFDKHGELILEMVRVALKDPGNFDEKRRLYVGTKDFLHEEIRYLLKAT
jgi:transcriptional regulator with XRE-family HTH domain